MPKRSRKELEHYGSEYSNSHKQNNESSNKRRKDEFGNVQKLKASPLDVSDPFSIPLPTDDDDDDDDDDDYDGKMNYSNATTSESDADFSVMLFQLASLNVADESLQTCPICNNRISLGIFPEHVNGCLDGIGPMARNSLRSQLEQDHDFAKSLALQLGYPTNYDSLFECPICGIPLQVGTGMNEHVNRCMDQQSQNEEKCNTNGGNVNDERNNDGTTTAAAVQAMSAQQMVACAGALLRLPKGTEQYSQMLDMFGTLGFNEKNVKNVLKFKEKEKQEISNNNYRQSPIQKHKMGGLNDNDCDDDDDDDDVAQLSPIREETLINANKNNSNNNNNLNLIDQFVFDNDDL